MTEQLNIAHLETAVRAGEASTLTSVTRLAPAAGPHASVAPARYLKGGNPTYIYEDRYIDGQSVLTVMIDSKSSAANRMETALNDAIDDSHPTLSRLPRIEVKYANDDEERTFRCLTLPHRAYDAHIRAGHVGEVPTTRVPEYLAARNSEPADALAMANMSFATVAFGGWDSSRRKRQGRFPSLLVGEVIGVLANQDSSEPRPAAHSGARVDPVAMGFDLSPAQVKAILEPQADEYSPKLTKKSGLRASHLGLGAIPPQADGLAGIATREIIRSHVLSFALLRRLRFGKSAEGDLAMRVLVAATLLNAMARSDSELVLRANCHLTEASAPVVRLDRRLGDSLALSPITIELADAILAEALAKAEPHGADWRGVTLQVTGNPAVLAAVDDTEE